MLKPDIVPSPFVPHFLRGNFNLPLPNLLEITLEAHCSKIAPYRHFKKCNWYKNPTKILYNYVIHVAAFYAAPRDGLKNEK